MTVCKNQWRKLGAEGRRQLQLVRDTLWNARRQGKGRRPRARSVPEAQPFSHFPPLSETRGSPLRGQASQPRFPPGLPRPTIHPVLMHQMMSALWPASYTGGGRPVAEGAAYMPALPPVNRPATAVEALSPQLVCSPPDPVLEKGEAVEKLCSPRAEIQPTSMEVDTAARPENPNIPYQAL